MARKLINEVGNKYGLLTVIKRNNKKWVCVCECGEFAFYAGHDLRRGKRKSCGCIGCFKVKHGMSNTPTYHTWENMKLRCYNDNRDNYNRYGGRGISVCGRWKDSFKNFYEDMGKRPNNKTIDRIDVNKNYTPDNCRWSTPKEQRANQRPY
jgi:hypothetical protein